MELTAVTGSQVPANTGVILYKAGGGDITPNIIAEATAFTGENANNELVGVTAETTVSYGPTDGKYNYIFQKQDDVLGFYKATGAKIRANRAYLSVTVPAASAPQKLNIMINNAGTTAISDEIKVNAEESQEKVYYNLAGQRVANPTKGLYIVNGKKVIIK
ncbi:MAG: hypothetical protein II404_09345 [Prevotella sp.]|nr:hypothetical protein [Prevotella sp.]